MKKYECLYIIHPDYDGEGISRVAEKVSEYVQSIGGEVVNVQHWGKRKLAYLIDKQRFGSYVLIHFSGESADIAAFQHELEIDSRILAYMTIRLDEFPDFDSLSIPQAYDAERKRPGSPRRGGDPRRRRDDEPREESSKPEERTDAEVPAEEEDEETPAEPEAEETTEAESDEAAPAEEEAADDASTEAAESGEKEGE